MQSRREFILEGAAAWAALLSGRAFAAKPGAMDGPGRRLRVGVLSDIHISEFGRPDAEERPDHNAKTFIKALRWFDERKVDAVIISGDLTNHAFKDQFLAVGKAWRTVFPDGKGSDGRTVEKFFICGNHDWEGWKYGKKGEKRYPNRKELAKHIFPTHENEFWGEAFDEPYEPIPCREIKGYWFLGAHWPYHSGDKVAEAIGACAAKAGTKPFFYLQHPHVTGSVFGGSAAKSGGAAAALEKCPNAIAITGHSHYSITDERSIWQGAYTALNAGSLRYVSTPSGRENSGPKRNSGFKAMPHLKPNDCRQGMLMDVYDDRIVFARREFVSGGEPLGPDWVVPLAGTKRPYEYSPRAAASKAPEFPEGAKVKVSNPAPGKTRDGKDVEQVTIEFPQTLPSAAGRDRVFDYRVELKVAYGRAMVWETNAVRRFMADGFCQPEDRMPKTMRCVMNATEIPRETNLLFEVRAANCFGVMSKPLVSDVIRFKGVVVKW